jgi:tetratricopeptide (TPR) repeat protein
MAQKNEKELGGPRKMSTGTKIAIGVFAVIMAFSMMLPSLTAIFSGASSSSSAEEQESGQAEEAASGEAASGSSDSKQDESAADDSGNKDDSTKESDSDKDDAKDDALKGVPDNETLKSLATQNAEKVASYEERLSEDPKNLAALLNAGQTYMSWGYSATYSSVTDEEKAYSEGLIKKAVQYFDRYLKVNDSVAVKVDKALCSYYMGKSDDAIKQLEKVAADEPENPLVWANLGMLYESQYENDKASDAYRKAVEADPNNEYGAKNYASQRLISINSKVSSPADAGDASADDVSTVTDTGLTSTLKNDAGVGY